jgi:hypothetical protein
MEGANMPVVTKRIADTISERSKTQGMISKWETWLIDNEPELIGLINDRANSVLSLFASRINSMGQIPLQEIFTAILSSGILGAMAIMQGANEVCFSTLNIDKITTLGAMSQEQMYEKWRAGSLPDEYYDAEHMGTDAVSCEDWEEAIKNHAEHTRSANKLVSRKSIISKLPVRDGDTSPIVDQPLPSNVHIPV